MTSHRDKFLGDLNNRYWEYQTRFFPSIKEYFERSRADDLRPPVFLVPQANHNVIIHSDAGNEETKKLLAFVPNGERHKWFRSMNSSQALAQSILGNLAANNLLGYLAEIEDDTGENLFGPANLDSKFFLMEHKIRHLGEPRPTSLDGYVSGKYQVAIECKFTEAEVGSCSRPRLKPTASNYGTDLCDGTYTQQLSRSKKCALSEIGVKYWDYVPQLFRWKNDIDLSPCPLNRNYQLIRNILAIAVSTDGEVNTKLGHAVLIYDGRNPSFQEGGDAYNSFVDVSSNLIEPLMLRKCSWQRLIVEMRSHKLLPWLTEGLAQKYGL